MYQADDKTIICKDLTEVFGELLGKRVIGFKEGPKGAPSPFVTIIFEEDLYVTFTFGEHGMGHNCTPHHKS